MTKSHRDIRIKKIHTWHEMRKVLVSSKVESRWEKNYVNKKWEREKYKPIWQTSDGGTKEVADNVAILFSYHQPLNSLLTSFCLLPLLAYSHRILRLSRWIKVIREIFSEENAARAVCCVRYLFFHSHFCLYLPHRPRYKNGN